jgi:autoinducer 2-degrading protein
MFVVTVTFEAYPHRADEFLARVKQQAADSLADEAGCHRFDVCTDPEVPGRVFLYELYSDEAAFRAHLETAHFRAFDAEAGPMLRSKAVETWTFVGNRVSSP